MILPVCEETDGHLIINLFDSDKRIVVNEEERDLATGIALAFTRGLNPVHIKYNGNSDSVWRMLSFLECVYDLKKVNIRRCVDGLMITKIGDQDV